MIVKFAKVEENELKQYNIQGRKIKEIKLLDDGTIVLVLKKEPWWKRKPVQ